MWQLTMKLFMDVNQQIKKVINQEGLKIMSKKSSDLKKSLKKVITSR
jgi:uncharacterized protein (DUF302 family)